MLENVACILAISTRSLIYLQGLVHEGLLPEICLVLTEDKTKLYAPFQIDIDEKQYDYINLDKTIGAILEVYKIPYIILETEDINSEDAFIRIRNIPQKYLIYSGYGGCILKRHLFEIGKKWIHVHAGKLPDYRGSTTAYYSMLQENRISATAIFMNADLDQGNIICSDSYEIATKVADIDYLYEPYIRSRVLIKALKQYETAKTFQEHDQENEKAEIYYIIHPVLKHIALLAIENNN